MPIDPDPHKERRLFLEAVGIKIVIYNFRWAFNTLENFTYSKSARKGRDGVSSQDNACPA